MKRFLALTMALMLAFAASAQIYDGITQPTTYRVWASVGQPTDNGNAAFSFFTGYKYDLSSHFSVTGVANYNVTGQAFTPAIWLNANIDGVVYFLSRNIYDAKNNKFKETLSATVKLPYGFMIDATWDNVFNGDSFLQGDRLQAVAGWGCKWVIFNAGYSMRSNPGLIANVRFKLTPAYWLQFKYDGGLKTIATNFAYHF